MKGRYGTIREQVSYNSLTLEKFSGISNFGSESSNLHSSNVYDTNSSDTKLVLKNLKIKINHRLDIGNLNIS